MTFEELIALKRNDCPSIEGSFKSIFILNTYLIYFKYRSSQIPLSKQRACCKSRKYLKAVLKIRGDVYSAIKSVIIINTKCNNN